MGQLLLLLVVALVAAALVFGVVTLISGSDQGLEPAEPDGTAVPLPATRPLSEVDLEAVRFDTASRGYRMAQVDQALRRAAYDLGYKEELINVLEAEITALREGRTEDADALRKARETAARPPLPGQEPATGSAPAASGDSDEPDGATKESVKTDPDAAESGPDAAETASSDAAETDAAESLDDDSDEPPVKVSAASGSGGKKADSPQ